jgi:Flp pilus assembly protein TadG
MQGPLKTVRESVIVPLLALLAIDIGLLAMAQTQMQGAMVLPLVIVFILGLREYSRYLMRPHVFTNAATVGATYAARPTDPIYFDGTTYGNATSNVTTVVTSAPAGQQLTGQNISVYESDALGNNLGTWTSAQADQYVCVQITGTYSFMLPTLFGLPSTPSQTFQSVKVSEGN